jgi:hypothetical protein
VIRLTPVTVQRASNRRLKLRGSNGVPVRVVNTRPVSIQLIASCPHVPLSCLIPLTEAQRAQAVLPTLRSRRERQRCKATHKIGVPLTCH